MLRVLNEVTVHEINGKETSSTQPVIVKNHWNDPALVLVTVAGVEVTVSATELAAAVKNATNTARF